MKQNDGPPPPNRGEQRPPYPQQMYGYQYDQQWFAHQQAMMQQQAAMHYQQQGYPIHPGAMHGGAGMDLGLGNLTLLGASSNIPEVLLGPFPCVKVSNLPHEVTMEDILILFQGFVVIDVLLFRSNEAFVVFANAMDFQMAMQRDRQTMGGRIIEVTPSQRFEYYAAIASKLAEKPQEEARVDASHAILGGEDAGQDGSLIDPSGVLSWALGQPPPTQALNNPTPEGSRGKGPGMQAGRGGAGRGAGPAVRRTGGGIQVGEHTGFLRMRGLPFSSAKDDIVKFFSGHKVIAETVVLTYRGDGRATGEGYIAFETPEDAQSAMTLHRNTMGSRYIELFISNKEEHNRAFTRFAGR
eukprot:CAMPEP_0119030466 /NCGR_PEP_ID=MMETSP1176-20130426/41043_1 /TAXON_ID=265551 /ORGANISM="Synedropsis recta cf, Strain CCMP1620" /LENGTH=353 /DNA_ID=CAMNT_0006986837 /DNA_START=624 /DNA_END=1685 /DNA_ORIENTATION=+